MLFGANARLCKFQFHNQLMKADSLIRNYFKIVPKGHNNCQLSIVNCQFGEVAKFQFMEPRSDTERRRAETTTHILRTTWPPALRANSNLSRSRVSEEQPKQKESPEPILVREISFFREAAGAGPVSSVCSRR